MLGHYHRRCHNVEKALAKFSHRFACRLIARALRLALMSKLGGVAREAHMSSWSGVPNRQTQAHSWQGVVGSTPCTQVALRRLQRYSSSTTKMSRLLGGRRCWGVNCKMYIEIVTRISIILTLSSSTNAKHYSANYASGIYWYRFLLKLVISQVWC